MRWIKEYKKADGIKGILVTGKSDEKLKYIKIILPKLEAFLYLDDFKIKEYKWKNF